MNGMWGELARDHWQHHLPNRYAALEDPDWYFDQLDQEASSYYLAIRDGQLKDINPNNATIGWAEFLKRVAWANQTARDIVATELIYLPGEDTDDNQADGDEREGPDW